MECVYIYMYMLFSIFIEFCKWNACWKLWLGRWLARDDIERDEAWVVNNIILLSILLRNSIRFVEATSSLYILCRDGNFALLHLMRVFPTLQRCWGANRARFLLHTSRQGDDGFRLFSLIWLMYLICNSFT